MALDNTRAGKLLDLSRAGIKLAFKVDYAREADVVNIVIAPQGFKGNISALQVARAIDNGIKRVMPEAVTAIMPMADGGEGTLEALVAATGGTIRETEVTGPLGGSVNARWGILPDKATAVVEMAAASGIMLVASDDLNPLMATTYGTGQLILAALDSGCRKLIIGIGGSATNDGGAGMAQALGVRLLDSKGASLPFGGAALARLERIDMSDIDQRLVDCNVVVACDVTNPLCGTDGASAVYGPQKGATQEMVKQLDAALSHYTDVIKNDLNIEVKDAAGSGAAGGLGAGLIAFLKAKIMPGIAVVIESTRLVEQLTDADLVFTGEGKIDAQTGWGKVPVGVARKAKEFGVPVIALAGEVASDYRAIYDYGIDGVLSIAPGPISLSQSMAKAEKLIADAAECALNIYLCGTKGRIRKQTGGQC
jgi:glycerate 2-kinase